MRVDSATELGPADDPIPPAPLTRWFPPALSQASVTVTTT